MRGPIMYENLLLAVVAGLFGLLPVFFQWLSDQAKDKSRNSHLSHLSAELDFLERWVKLSRGRSSDEQTAQHGAGSQSLESELTHILLEYRSLRERERIGHVPPYEVSPVRRALLLFRPRPGKAWIHTTFYFLIIFIVVMIVSDLRSPTFDPKTGENEFKYLLIGILAIFGPLLLWLQRAAVRIKKGERKQPTHQ
jgi:hypothetical protein